MEIPTWLKRTALAIGGVAALEWALQYWFDWGVVQWLLDLASWLEPVLFTVAGIAGVFVIIEAITGEDNL